MISNFINKFLKKFGIQLKKINALEIERNECKKILKGAAEILRINKKYEHKILNRQLSCLVFSKDRAMQLHALLTSYFQLVQNACPLSILYKATGKEMQKAYEDLKLEFASFPVMFITEKLFYEQVKKWLETTAADRVFFLTDDAIFLDGLDMDDALLFNPANETLSLSKGKDLTFCFTLNMKQDLPVFDNSLKQHNKIFNFWSWGSCPASPSWTYPISIDGTFFLREELLGMIENTSFNNPNSLEANLQVFVQFFLHRQGVCYDKVKLVNVPCNLVQKTFNNRSTGFFSAKELQLLWESGKRIDVKKFYGLNAFEAEHMKYEFL